VNGPFLTRPLYLQLRDLLAAMPFSAQFGNARHALTVSVVRVFGTVERCDLTT
jgi:hypothetical protein